MSFLVYKRWSRETAETYESLTDALDRARSLATDNPHTDFTVTGQGFVVNIYFDVTEEVAA